MTRINDPDFGPIDLQPTSEADWQAAQKTIADRIRETRNWPVGITRECPRCRKHALTGRDDIRYQVVDEAEHVHTFYNLPGGHCSACGLDMIEPASLLDIEQTVHVGFKAVFSGKVSNIGRDTLGTYWSRDVERNLGLHAGDRLDVELIGRDSMLVRVRHEHP